MAQVVGRFAPTPSGQLHLGNLFCSLIAWLAAKSQGGKILLRSEDLDVERSRPEYALQAQRDLEALGLFWDEGGNCSGPLRPLRPKPAVPILPHPAGAFGKPGPGVPCFRRRAQLHAASAPHASDGETIYAGTCRGLSPRGGGTAQDPRPGPAGCECRRNRLPSPTSTTALNSNTCPPAAGISSFAAPMGSTPTSWPWWPTTAPWGSPRWCGGGACCPSPPGRSCCTGCWAGLCRNLATRPCSWRRGAGGFPSGTATSAFPGCWKRG